MRPGVLSGKVTHHRYKPKVHRFTYKMFWHVIDLSDMKKWSSLSFSHALNRWSLYSIYDRDYVDDKPKPILLKINTFLQRQGVVCCDRVMLVTHPRFLGFSFNSVSFYFCYQNGKIRALISEINNTPWGEKNLYCHPIKDADLCSWSFRFEKAFHISPFVSMDVFYEWHFKLTDDSFQVVMRLQQQSQKLMDVNLFCRWQDYDTLSQSRQWIGQSMKMWLAIYWQAFKLWFKKVPFHEHPKVQVRKKHESK